MAWQRHETRKSLRTNFNPGKRYYLERAKLRAAQAAHLPGLLRGGELDRPIFIVGAPRSGTTLLYNVLRSSSLLAHWRPSEAHEVWEADYHPRARGWESNVLGPGDVDPAAARRIRRTLFLVAGTRRRLIDKTPRNVLRIPFIDAIFPDARYVLLVRDGRENVNSLINAWRSPRYRTYALPRPHSIPGTDPAWWKFILYPGWKDDLGGPLEVVCARQWLAGNDHGLSALEGIEAERRTMVRYEDLVDDPVAEVGKMMERIDLPYEASVREQAAAVHSTPVNYVTPPEKGKWKRENPGEIDAVLPLLAPMMKRLGYED